MFSILTADRWRHFVLSIALVAVVATLMGCSTGVDRPLDGATVAPSAKQAGVGATTKAAARSPSAVSPKLGKDSWVSWDGATFPYTVWRPKSEPRTVVVAVHGLSGAPSDFWPLGEYLKSRSTAVYSYALRGQGCDPDRRRVGDIKRPELWYADLDTFLTLVRAAHPKARLFLYGESLGGLISIYGMEKFTEDNRKAVRGLILASPVVSLKDRKTVPRLRYLAMEGAIRILPGARISLERLASGKKDMLIAGDTDHRENVRRTPHAVNHFTFRLLGTLERLIDGSREKAAKLAKPVLVVYPAHDLLTTAEDVEAWYGYLASKDKEKYLFKKSYHMLLHDEERAQVLKTVGNWIGRH